MIHLPLCSADVSVHTRVLVLICTPFNKLLKIKLFFQKLTRMSYVYLYGHVQSTLYTTTRRINYKVVHTHVPMAHTYQWHTRTNGKNYHVQTNIYYLLS